MDRKLFELQEADNTITRLRRERAKLNDGSSLRAERDTLQKAVEEETQRLQRMHTDRTDKELQLKTAEEKIARQNSRLMSATASHEVTALQRDIESLNRARGDLDEAILILMDEGDTGQAHLADLDSQLKEKVAATAQAEAHFKAETERIEAEIAATQARREALAHSLDPEHLEKYDEVAASHHGVAVVHPEKGNCSACGMTIPTVRLKEAKTKEWPECESCGRLLFVE
jgi:predicted  nucleic acid-binding Zn-ribbon protein